MSEYKMPPLGLFGRRCKILTGYDKRPFVYRIVNSEWRSNSWCEPPLTFQSEHNPVHHDYYEDVLIVVLDTLISEDSRLIRVARKDVELMDEKNEGWISVKERLPDEEGIYIVFWDGEVTTLTYVPPFHEHPYGWHAVCGLDWTKVRMNDVTHWMLFPEPPKEKA